MKKPTPTGVKLELIAQSELLGERDHPLIRGHDHVVEAVDAMTAEVERSGESSGRRRSLQQRHVGAGLGQAKRQHGAKDAGADDADARTARVLLARAGHRPPATARSCTRGRSSVRAAMSSPPSGEIGGG